MDIYFVNSICIIEDQKYKIKKYLCVRCCEPFLALTLVFICILMLELDLFLPHDLQLTYSS